MGKVILLGTASFIPSAEADNTHLAILAGDRTVLVDTATNPFLSLKKGGIEPNEVTDLVLTHFHPDHVSGLPILLMGMWFTRRKGELHIYGLEYTLNRAKKMLELFNISSWANLFPIHYHLVIGGGFSTLISDKDLRLFGAEVKHLIPTMGIRVEFPASGKTLAYSCDTEPCGAVEILAKGANVLLHESAGNSKGHSSAEQAGETAQKAGVETLYLIHYPGESDPDRFIEQARSVFDGQVIAARDMMTIVLD
jgi:ribonuclease Z